MSKVSNNLTKRLRVWAIVVAAVLMIPYLTKAAWTLGDYIFGGIVLFGAPLGYEVVTMNMKSKMHRMIVAALAILGVIGIWGFAVSGS